MKTKQKFFRWLLVSGYALLIYSTLYIVRVFSLYLGKHHLLFFVIASIYVIIALILILLCIRLLRPPNMKSIAPIFFIVSVVIYLLKNMAYLDKRVHLAEYGLMGFLALRAFSLHLKIESQAYANAFILTAVIGIVDELIELFIPTRFCSVGDMIMDAVGGAIGLSLAAIFAKRWEARTVFAQIALFFFGIAILLVTFTQNHVEFFRRYLS